MEESKITVKEFDGRQGVELEIFVKNRSFGNEHDEAVSLFKEGISGRWYFDDGKPEYPTKPHNNLRDLEKEINTIMKTALEISKSHNWDLLFIGSDPYATDFASGHIHASISKKPPQTEIKIMGDKLYSIQSFIALIGQNSPICDGKITYCKDARLGYSTWSRFTPYEETGGSHYLSLASGSRGHSNVNTIEVRIPSSAIPEQIFANTALIKTIIQLPFMQILPLIQCKNNFFKVIRYGGEALVPILKPIGLGYLGLKGKNVYIKISELFRLLLNDECVKPILSDTLKEISPSLRKRVEEFYRLITHGFTVSDFMMQTFLNNPSQEDMQDILGEVSKNGFLNNGSFIDVLDKPERPLYPLLEDKISLEEVEEMIKKQNFDFTNFEVNEVEKILDDDNPYSIKRSSRTREILIAMGSGDRGKLITLFGLRRTNFTYLRNNEIIDNNHFDTKGRLFDSVYQLAVERGLI